MRVELTPFEFRLLEALRSRPNRTAMWVELGDPARHLQELIALYRAFFDICNRERIGCWLEFGSLLGYVRHGGIIPWEWDLDVGCAEEDYRRLIEVGERIERADSHWGFRMEQHADYNEPGLLFYSKTNPEITGDIALYRRQGERLVCAAPSWNYPDHQISDVFPLRRVTMLGQSALIPARPEALLSRNENTLGQSLAAQPEPVRNEIGYMQYDPVPFLLLKMFHPDTAELLCSPPVSDVSRTAEPGLPVVLRKGETPPPNLRCIAPESGSMLVILADISHAAELELRPFEDLLFLSRHALWGKMYQVWLEAGDTVVVPVQFAVKTILYP